MLGRRGVRGGGVRISAYVPGLLGPWPRALHRQIGEGLGLPALLALLRRSGAPAPLGSFAVWRRPRMRVPLGWNEFPLEVARLEALAGVGRSGACGRGPGTSWFPLAALSYYRDAGRRPDGVVMRCDPVCLEAEALGARMIGPGELALEPSETAALCDEINAALVDEGLQVDAPVPERWYLHVSGDAPVSGSRQGSAPGIGAGWPETSPPSLVAPGAVARHLPRGAAGPEWRRRLNDLQMILHRSPVNETRIGAGRRPVNSLWLWGAGRLGDERPEVPFDTVWCAAAEAAGMARLGGAADAPPPPGGQGWVETLERGRHLLVLDALFEPLLARDVEAWRERLSDYEARWFVPLLAAFEAGSIARLELDVGVHGRFRPLTVRRSMRASIGASNGSGAGHRTRSGALPEWLISEPVEDDE